MTTMMTMMMMMMVNGDDGDDDDIDDDEEGEEAEVDNYQPSHCANMIMITTMTMAMTVNEGAEVVLGCG